MKTIRLLILTALLALATVARAQNTDFPYQGFLMENGGPDMRSSIFSSGFTPRPMSAAFRSARGTARRLTVGGGYSGGNNEITDA